MFYSINKVAKNAVLPLKLDCASSLYGLCELCHFIRINNYVNYILHSDKRFIFNFDSKILCFTRVIIQLLPSYDLNIEICQTEGG